MPTPSQEKRKCNPNHIAVLIKNKESFISCSYMLIYHTLWMTIEHAKRGNDKLWGLMDEMLHSIFFIGYINKSPRLTPNDYFVKQPEIHELVKKKFCAPFRMYKSHLPTRTPFSILLNMMEELYCTEEDIKGELLDLLKKMKFPNPLHQPGSKYEQFYTLESTVICVCYSETDPQRKYYGASLSCRKGNAKEIVIDASCLNTWHEYVSHAVMSFNVGATGDGITFPESVKCQAYKRDWNRNVYIEREPCLNCKELFNLKDANLDKANYPYGNCAETEGLSKLLIKDRIILQNTWIENHTEENLETLRYNTKARLKMSLGLNSENFLFYSPMKIERDSE